LNPAAKAVEERARKALIAQLSAALIAAAGFLVYEGAWHALSALSGGLVSIALLLLLRRGIRRAGDIAQHDQKKSMLILYMGAAQRFLLIMVLFALGLGVLKFDPLAMFVGFFLAQLSNLINARG